MEQRVDGKGRESQGKTDGQAKKVVATRTVDKLLEQSRLSAPGSVRNRGEGEKKEEPEVKVSVPSSAAGNEKEKRKPVRKKESRDKEKTVAEEKESGSDKEAAARQEKNGGQGEAAVSEQKNHGKEETMQRERKNRSKDKGTARLNKLGSVGRWFQILCFVHIPLFGFLYMLVKALRRKTPEEERHFAVAYILYRILILFLALTILYVLYKIGLQFVDGILDYAGMEN